MAGNWIKMGTDLRTHPKVVRIASALNADGCPDTLRTVGALHALWCIFDAHSEDGQLTGYTPAVADQLIGLTGFTAAVIAVGWATFDGETLALPRFDTHNGQSAKRRAQEMDRKRDARKVSAPDADKKRTRIEKEKKEEQNPPTPQGGEASAAAKPSRERKLTFARWLEVLKETGDRAVPQDDAVFAFARSAGIPSGFVKVAWFAFRGYHLDRPEKKQLDWRAVFRNYVRENYQKLWRTRPEGGYELTDKGVQAERAMLGEANGQA